MNSSCSLSTRSGDLLRSWLLVVGAPKTPKAIGPCTLHQLEALEDEVDWRLARLPPGAEFATTSASRRDLRVSQCFHNDLGVGLLSWASSLPSGSSPASNCAADGNRWVSAPLGPGAFGLVGEGGNHWTVGSGVVTVLQLDSQYQVPFMSSQVMVSPSSARPVVPWSSSRQYSPDL